MSDRFFDAPILNSPYEYPARHWELDESRQPTGQELPSRRPADFITPIPKPKKRRQSQEEVQQTLALFDTEGISDDSQTYDLSLFINSIRDKVNAWRQLPDPKSWKVTPTTEKLLQHWRHYPFQGIRPFFCQVEAVETAIWLAKVAPKSGKKERAFLQHLEEVNEEANPELMRICLKLATGGRQNDSHGDADCMANPQRGQAPDEQQIHERLSDRDAGYHYPRSPPRAPAQRPRQLLR